MKAKKMKEKNRKSNYDFVVGMAYSIIVMKQELETINAKPEELSTISKEIENLKRKTKKQYEVLDIERGTHPDSSYQPSWLKSIASMERRLKREISAMVESSIFTLV